MEKLKQPRRDIAMAKRTGKRVELGRLNWHADSWHIYGKDIENAKQQLFDRIDSMTFEERTYNFHDPFIQEMFNEAEAKVISRFGNMMKAINNS